MHDEEGELQEKLSLICSSLNLDKACIDESWRNFSEVHANFTLEGDAKQWIGCAVYLACRKARVRATGRPGVSMEGSFISFNALLRACELQVSEFFKKCKRWVDMSQGYETLRPRVEHLERKFIVSNIAFTNVYRPVFVDMFQDPNSTSNYKTKKARYIGCSITKLYEFGWMLFLLVKSRVPDVAEDLVNTIHLLLATCDLLYANVLMADRRDLLNPDFPGLPSDFFEPTYKIPPKANCVIDVLVSRHGAIAVEAYFAMTYCLKPIIDGFVRENFLRGKGGNVPQTLLCDYFELNLRIITSKYAEYVISVSDFDERIFLRENAEELLGPVVKNAEPAPNVDVTPSPPRRNLTNPTITPLSCRDLVRDRDVQVLKEATPLCNVTMSANMFLTLIGERKAAPSPALLEKIIGCSSTQLDEMERRIKEMKKMFRDAITEGQVPSESLAFLEHRLEQATILYYRVLENVLAKENQSELNKLLEKEIIQKTVFACCLEITLFSFNAHRKFPWLLDVFQIDPLDFYRIIEIVVRAEDQLSRSVVKHLTMIEERILESLAWRSTSPLWVHLTASGGLVPKCNEVALPYQLMTEEEMRNEQQQIGTQRIRVSLSERFISPVQRVVIRSGSSDNSTQSVALAQNAAAANGLIAGSQNNRALRTGSLALFFRKFYFLANVRMQDLCSRLDIIDMELRQKIWTCFEFSIVNHSDLMQDRHLDQILMCSVYVMCRVLHTADQPTNTKFTDILKHYRSQPQAESQIYRNVLMSRAEENNGVEDRGNLIQFYNQVYMHRIQNHARRYIVQEEDRNSVNRSLLLSPLPRLRTPTTPHNGSNQSAPLSATSAVVRKLTQDKIILSPMTGSTVVSDEPNSVTISLDQSPLKELDEVNKKIKISMQEKQKSNPVKRIMIYDGKEVQHSAAKKARDLVRRVSNGNQL